MLKQDLQFDAEAWLDEHGASIGKSRYFRKGTVVSGLDRPVVKHFLAETFNVKRDSSLYTIHEIWEYIKPGTHEVFAVSLDCRNEVLRKFSVEF